MRTRSVILILVTIVSSIVLVIGLYALSTDIRKRPGSFLRITPPHPIVKRASLNIADANYYIAGATHDMIYLAHSKYPLNILGVRSDLRDTVHYRLRLAGIERQKHYRITVRVDSPYFYFMDGAIPFYYRGMIKTWEGTNVLDSTYYIDAVPISKNSFALRGLYARTGGNVLGKKELNTRGAMLYPDLLQEQHNDPFTTDGILHFNKELNRLLYVYFYRNEYVVMDTTFMVINRGHTLDTTTIAQVRSDSVASQRARRRSAPPMAVHLTQCVYGPWLFVQSPAAARNEVMENLDSGSVFDVYDLTNSEYMLSFYLPHVEGERVKNIIIVNQMLFAHYDHSLHRYDLMERNFKRLVKPRH